MVWNDTQTGLVLGQGEPSWHQPQPNEEITMTKFEVAKRMEAEAWQRNHSPYAPKPRIIAAVLRGEPLPREPLVFG